MPALDQSRKIRGNALVVPVNAGAGHPLEAAERQIIGNAHAGEQTSALRYISDATARDLRGDKARRILALQPDRACRGRSNPDHGLEQRRLAGTVAAEQSEDFVLAHVERNRVENVALAIEGVDAVDHQYRSSASRGNAPLCS